MSITDYTKEPDVSYWEMYLIDCKANNIKPSLSDYDQWYTELNLDMADNYER
jgi:hypothetical protein